MSSTAQTPDAVATGSEPPNSVPSNLGLDIDMKNWEASTSTALGKRRAARVRRDLVGPINADDDQGNSSEEDQKPSKKKAKTVTKTPASGGSRRIQEERGLYIGIYKLDEDELPVLACYYKNGALNCRVYHEDCSEEVVKRQAEFFHSKAQVTMDRITFDPTLFPELPNIQELKADEDKRKRIRAYLENHGIQRPGKKSAGQADASVENSTSSKTRATSKVPSKATVKDSTSSKAQAPATRKASTVSETSKSKGSSGVTTSAQAAPTRVSTSTQTGPFNYSTISLNDISLSFDDNSLSISGEPLLDPENPNAIHIGFWIPKSSIPVFAYFKITSVAKGTKSLCFKMRGIDVTEEVRGMPAYQRRASINFDLIKVLDQYTKANDDNTKEYIKFLLVQKENRPVPEQTEFEIDMAKEKRQSQKESAIIVDVDLSDEEIPAVITAAHQKMIEKKQKAKEAQLLKEAGVPKQSARLASKKNAACKTSSCGTLGDLGNSVEAEQPGSGNETEVQEVPAPDHVAPGSRSKDTSKDSLSKYKQTIKDQAQEIKNLQEQVRRMIEEKDLAIAQQPTTIVGTTVVDNITYQMLGTGPNAGKLLTKDWTKVIELNKVYKEWLILSEIQLNVGNQDEVVGVQNISGLDFYHIPNGEHKGRLIQAVTDQSVLVTPEGQFIQWRLREEIKGEHQLFP